MAVLRNETPVRKSGCHRKMIAVTMTTSMVSDWSFIDTFTLTYKASFGRIYTTHRVGICLKQNSQTGGLITKIKADCVFKIRIIY